jgi:antitoxin FitA
MATLTIRNVPASVHKALRKRAETHARSVEAEVRALLEASARQGAAKDWRDVVADVQRRAAAALDARGAPSDWSLAEELLTARRLEFMREEGLLPKKQLDRLEARLRRFDLRLGEVEQLLGELKRREP